VLVGGLLLDDGAGAGAGAGGAAGPGCWLKLADWSGAAAVAGVSLPLLVPHNAKSDAPRSMACCLLLAIVSGHPHRDSQPDPLLTCPFPHPILAFSRFVRFSLPPGTPRPPQPPAPAPSSSSSAPSLVPPRRPGLPSTIYGRCLAHCIARGRPRMNLPTQRTRSGPDLQCCCPSSHPSSHLQLAPGTDHGNLVWKTLNLAP